MDEAVFLDDLVALEDMVAKKDRERSLRKLVSIFIGKDRNRHKRTRFGNIARFHKLATVR